MRAADPPERPVDEAQGRELPTTLLGNEESRSSRTRRGNRGSRSSVPSVRGRGEGADEQAKKPLPRRRAARRNGGDASTSTRRHSNARLDARLRSEKPIGTSRTNGTAGARHTRTPAASDPRRRRMKNVDAVAGRLQCLEQQPCRDRRAARLTRSRWGAYTRTRRSSCSAPVGAQDDGRAERLSEMQNFAARSNRAAPRSRSPAGARPSAAGTARGARAARSRTPAAPRRSPRRGSCGSAEYLPRAALEPKQQRREMLKPAVRG